MRFTIHPFPAVLPDVESDGLVPATKSYALKLRTFYDSRAMWHRRLYRLSGILVILVGAGLPVLVNLDYPAKSLVVSLAGTLVAITTALRAFYRWDQSWVLLRATESAITKAYWEWQAQLPDDEDHTRTRRFLGVLAELRVQEQITYFNDLPFPSAVPAQPAAR